MGIGKDVLKAPNIRKSVIRGILIIALVAGVIWTIETRLVEALIATLCTIVSLLLTWD